MIQIIMAQIEDFVLEQNILNIPVIVKGIDFDKWEWREKTDIVSVSRNSRGIILSRKCQIGHLLCLERDFDAESESAVESYDIIWGIVHHCTLISAKNLDEKFDVGLALIGENPPQDYFENPTQYYRICGIGKDGFWKIEQTEVEFIPRKHPRFLVSIEVFLGILDDSSNLGDGEKVFTENISFGGAAVFSDLALKIGDCVKFISARYEFSALAVVRNITKTSTNKQKIHLEFIAGRFPVEKVNM